jgi:hypothetical protein
MSDFTITMNGKTLEFTIQNPLWTPLQVAELLLGVWRKRNYGALDIFFGVGYKSATLTDEEWTLGEHMLRAVLKDYILAAR